MIITDNRLKQSLKVIIARLFLQKGCKTSRCSIKKKGERCNEACECKNYENIEAHDSDMVDDEFDEIFGSDEEVYEDIVEKEVVELNDNDDDVLF